MLAVKKQGMKVVNSTEQYLYLFCRSMLASKQQQQQRQQLTKPDFVIEVTVGFARSSLKIFKSKNDFKNFFLTVSFLTQHSPQLQQAIIIAGFNFF